MKRFPMLLAIALLSGCSGLNVGWVVQASYNTPATTAATITTGAVLPPLPVPVVKP